LDPAFAAERGLYLDGFRNDSKARLLDFDPIDSIRKTLNIQIAQIAGAYSIVVLIRSADNLHRCFHAKPGRIGNLNAQFAVIALARKRQGDEKNNNGKYSHKE
jgi:hypothetical protein